MTADPKLQVSDYDPVFVLLRDKAKTCPDVWSSL